MCDGPEDYIIYEIDVTAPDGDAVAVRYCAHHAANVFARPGSPARVVEEVVL